MESMKNLTLHLPADRYRVAADRLLELACQGPYTTVDPGSIRREEIYERGKFGPRVLA
jgi:hypothetical protein